MMTAPPPRRYGDRLNTVRVRTTVGALLVVGVALFIGATALVVTVRNSLAANVETAALLRAQDVVAAVEGAPDPAKIPLTDGDDSFVQLIDASGKVIASSVRTRGLGPVTTLSAGESETIPRLAGEAGDTFRVIARSAGATTGRVLVLAGRSLDPVGESTSIVVRFLLLGIPLLMMVVAITTWYVVGRALRFVDSMRAQVAEISTTELHRRVPTPPGDDEIARLAGTMNSMLARLETDQKRLRTFISDASHELRSPVATIRNQAEVALAHPSRTDLRELAANVLAEDMRLEKLVEELLVLARLEEQHHSLKLHPIDLDDIVLEEARRLRDSTSYSIDSSKVSGGRVRGDAAQLRRVIRNLADNAARHARSAVAFSLLETGEEVVLTVDDDGPGIAPEHRHAVFERFTRLDEARDRDLGGAGLGLAIVMESIRMHGGSIEVTDSPSGGARFEVRLPQVR